MRQSRYWFAFLTVVQAECASYFAANKCCKTRAATNTGRTVRIVYDLPSRPDKNPGAARDQQNWCKRDDRFAQNFERAIRYKTECSSSPLCARRNHYKPDDGAIITPTSFVTTALTLATTVQFVSHQPTEKRVRKKRQLYLSPAISRLSKNLSVPFVAYVCPVSPTLLFATGISLGARLVLR